MPRPDGPNRKKTIIENTIPVVAVTYLQAGIRFYVEKLGFSLDWGGEPGSPIGSVSRNGHCIMLSQTDAGAPTTVWVGVSDAALFQEYQAAGVQVVQEPTNQPWAYEMKISDLDGNILWLGAEPLGEGG